MAASTSLSFSNTCSTFPSMPSSSKALSHFVFVNNNNPILPIKDKRFSNTLSKLHQPLSIKYGNIKRGFLFKASSSDHPFQDSSAPTINGPDAGEDVLGNSEDEASHTLKSLLQFYKEAVLDGDGKTVSEIEAMLHMVEKEKIRLLQVVSDLSAEINSGKEKYLRLQADFDNFRKRSEKERLTIRSDAQGEVIESLLPMVDNFERAKQQLILETEKEKKIDASYQGIYKQFVEIMRSLRVAVVSTVGKPFDPSVHEAIAREESQEFKEGIVIQEFRRGFLLGDRLLRPAMVKVSSGPGKKQKAPMTDKSSEQPATTAGVDDR